MHLYVYLSKVDIDKNKKRHSPKHSFRNIM